MLETNRETNHSLVMEVIHPPHSPFSFAIFDFDGTVSLLREGWQAIMYGYFTEELAACPDAQGEDACRADVMDFVDRLTGKQTVFQCIELAEQVAQFGGVPKDPLAYKAEYLRRLMNAIHERHEILLAGGDPEPYLVPGVRDMLRELSVRNIACYLTSGTDEVDVIREAQLLGVAGLFRSIHGATDKNSTVCSKEQVLRALIEQKGLSGSGLLAFGDGYVEIELAKQVGGYAVAVATNEAKRDATVDEWKRSRLIGAGADCVIPDFSQADRVAEYLCGRI